MLNKKCYLNFQMCIGCQNDVTNFDHSTVFKSNNIFIYRFLNIKILNVRLTGHMLQSRTEILHLNT